MRTIMLSLLLFTGLAPTSALAEGKAPPAPMSLPVHGIPGVSEEMLEPGFWTGQLQGADDLVLDAGAITARNARLMAMDPSMHRLDAFGPELRATQVR
ncbi:MAG: NlpC-P60 family protein, partial [Arenimonas sp.]